MEQDEIQAFLKHVTVFTCVVWASNQVHSFAVISDNLAHDKSAVYVFL